MRVELQHLDFGRKQILAQWYQLSKKVIFEVIQFVTFVGMGRKRDPFFKGFFVTSKHGTKFGHELNHQVFGCVPSRNPFSSPSGWKTLACRNCTLRS